MDTKSEFFIKNNSDKLIISFGGCALQFGDILPFEFFNFLNKHFPSYDKYFFIDKSLKWYHHGIDGISSNIEQTIIYIKNIIKKYKEVIFIGTSDGGYASILFGSLLDVDIVLAFVPQTVIEGDDLNPLYKNLNNVVNKTTNYNLYGDINIPKIDHLHHINHCYNIGHHKNVMVTNVLLVSKHHQTTKQIIDLKELRDSGELLEIFNKLLK